MTIKNYFQDELPPINVHRRFPRRQSLACTSSSDDDDPNDIDPLSDASKTSHEGKQSRRQSEPVLHQYNIFHKKLAHLRDLSKLNSVDVEEDEAEIAEKSRRSSAANECSAIKKENMMPKVAHRNVSSSTYMRCPLQHRASVIYIDDNDYEAPESDISEVTEDISKTAGDNVEIDKYISGTMNFDTTETSKIVKNISGAVKDASGSTAKDKTKNIATKPDTSADIDTYEITEDISKPLKDSKDTVKEKVKEKTYVAKLKIAEKINTSPIVEDISKTTERDSFVSDSEDTVKDKAKSTAKAKGIDSGNIKDIKIAENISEAIKDASKSTESIEDANSVENEISSEETESNDTPKKDTTDASISVITEDISNTVKDVLNVIKDSMNMTTEISSVVRNTKNFAKNISEIANIAKHDKQDIEAIDGDQTRERSNDSLKDFQIHL